jgi:hypothetical protein
MLHQGHNEHTSKHDARSLQVTLRRKPAAPVPKQTPCCTHAAPGPRGQQSAAGDTPPHARTIRGKHEEKGSNAGRGEERGMGGGRLLELPWCWERSGAVPGLQRRCRAAADGKALARGEESSEGEGATSSSMV